MGIINKKEIQDVYKKEAGSLIKKIEKGLSCFNKRQTTNNEQLIFRLFRYAHTLKGISGTCGFYKIEETAGIILEIFRAAKDEKIEMSHKHKIIIKKSLRVCERLLNAE